MRLPDGTNDVRLNVQDNAGIITQDSVLITVAAVPPETVLSEIPGLTPNQQRMANKLDSMCNALSQLANNDVALSDQTDLPSDSPQRPARQQHAASQLDAIEELIRDDFAVARTQTLLFANTQYAGIMDRLIALRGGAKGLSLAGLNIIVDGKLVPLAQIEEMAKQFSAAARAPGWSPAGLLSRQVGPVGARQLQLRQEGCRPDEPRVRRRPVGLRRRPRLPASPTRLCSAERFRTARPASTSRPTTASSIRPYSVSLYGSAYAAKNFYFDGIVNSPDSSYDAYPQHHYVDGLGPGDRRRQRATPTA